MTAWQSIYEALLASPGDTATMLVLADALEDEGRDKLAAAYRWAAERGRWPFERLGRRKSQDEMNKVWDWDLESRENAAPERSRLPRDLYDALRRLEKRKYSDVNQAFVLLANVLSGHKEFAPC